MITLHGRADSSNVQKIVWALHEMDMPFRRIDRGGRFGGLDAEAFRALSPPGRIPALVDEDGVELFESNAILRHLGRTLENDLWPVDDPARLARAEAVMDWSATAFWPAIRPAFRAVCDGGEEERDSPVVGAMIDAALEHVDVLGALVENGWAAGPDFTLADIPPAVALHRLAWTAPHARLPRSVLDWRRRIAMRPAFAESVYWPEP